MKLLLDAEQGVAVGEALIALQTRYRVGIAAQLAVGLKRRTGDPDQRVKPVQRAQHGGHPVPQDIAEADVLEFVQKDVAQAGGIEALLPIDRQQQTGTTDTEHRRGDAGFGHHGDQGALQTDLKRGGAQQRFQFGIVTGLALHRRGEAPLPPQHRSQ